MSHSDIKNDIDEYPGELLVDEVLHDVDRHGEDDGGVVLRGDGAQSLQVPQLQYRENKNQISLNYTTSI